jgi:hypothetical protein
MDRVEVDPFIYIKYHEAIPSSTAVIVCRSAFALCSGIRRSAAGWAEFSQTKRHHLSIPVRFRILPRSQELSLFETLLIISSSPSSEPCGRTGSLCLGWICCISDCCQVQSARCWFERAPTSFSNLNPCETDMWRRDKETHFRLTENTLRNCLGLEIGSQRREMREGYFLCGGSRWRFYGSYIQRVTDFVA